MVVILASWNIDHMSKRICIYYYNYNFLGTQLFSKITALPIKSHHYDFSLNMYSRLCILIIPFKLIMFKYNIFLPFFIVLKGINYISSFFQSFSMNSRISCIKSNVIFSFIKFIDFKDCGNCQVSQFHLIIVNTVTFHHIHTWKIYVL